MSLSTTPSPAAPRPIQPSESSTVPSAGTAPKSQGTAPGTQQPGRPAGPGSVQLSGARVSEPVSDQQKSEQSKPTTASGNKFLNVNHPLMVDWFLKSGSTRSYFLLGMILNTVIPPQAKLTAGSASFLRNGRREFSR